METFSFFLPTKDNWYGTYPGGYVECVISDGLNPELNQIRIGFWGNDDTALVKDGEKYDPTLGKQKIFEAFKFVQEIPRPISKEYLRKIGFEPF